LVVRNKNSKGKTQKCTQNILKAIIEKLGSMILSILTSYYIWMMMNQERESAGKEWTLLVLVEVDDAEEAEHKTKDSTILKTLFRTWPLSGINLGDEVVVAILLMTKGMRE